MNKQGLLKIYTESELEYLKDGYYSNNTMLFNNKTVPFYYDIIATSGTVYLEQINEEKLKSKILDTVIVNEFSLNVTSEQVYLSEQTADEGLYRFKIFIDSIYYYSDIFCVKEQTLTEINTMPGGLLKVYDADYLEYYLDGYIKNHTLLKNSGKTVPFYFDTELTIITFRCELYDITKLNTKQFSEVKIKDVTLLQADDVLYLGEQNQNVGIFRYKITVNSIPFYSEMFEVCKAFCGTFTYNNDDCFSFNDGTYFDFN